MFQKTIHKLDIIDGVPFVLFENYNPDENGKLQHILVWFIYYNDEMHGDFVDIVESDDKEQIPDLVKVITKQATNTVKQLKK